MPQTLIEGKNKKEQMCQLVCFMLGEEEYAFDMHCVQVAVRVSPITAVPQVPEYIMGVMNLRGALYTIIDLGKKMGIKHKPQDEDTRIIIANTDSVSLGVVVDRILDNRWVPVSAINREFKNKNKMIEDFINGVVIVESCLIVVLDIVKINTQILQEVSAAA